MVELDQFSIDYYQFLLNEKHSLFIILCRPCSGKRRSIYTDINTPLSSKKKIKLVYDRKGRTYFFAFSVLKKNNIVMHIRLMENNVMKIFLEMVLHLLLISKKQIKGFDSFHDTIYIAPYLNFFYYEKLM